MNFLEDEKGKSIESNVVQKLCNETRNTMNLSFARITSIDYTYYLEMMKVFITHQLDCSDPILNLAPIRNLDCERDVGAIKYKLRSLKQSS